MDESPAQRLNRFVKLGAIDLRVDYLRPGMGEWFELRAEVIRLGSRVASTRMEFLGADGKLLSTAAAYIVLETSGRRFSLRRKYSAFDSRAVSQLELWLTASCLCLETTGPEWLQTGSGQWSFSVGIVRRAAYAAQRPFAAACP